MPGSYGRRGQHRHPESGRNKERHGSVVYTGKTTITVQSDIVRCFNRTCDIKALSNSCLFTFRNVDANMQPQPVPFIYPVTYAEDARFLNAFRQRLD